MRTSESQDLLHDLTNSVCAMVGAADTLAVHHERLTPRQREALVGCLRRQSDILQTLAGTLQEAGIGDSRMERFERPDARETVAGVVDLVTVTDDGVTMQLRDRDA